jgi:two-component system nitrate/nitrite response regulator NarL
MNSNGTKVRILIVDDHTLFREGVTRVLNNEPDFEVVAHCASVQDALHIISDTKVDIVLLDFALGQVARFDFFTKQSA